MDTVTHNGLVYVKASVLAKRHRYTTDYVGQLCRQNKVDAQLVGRAWYVNEHSLLNHKIDHKKDTRSNEIMSKNSIQVTVSPSDSVERVKVHSVTSKKTFRQFFSPELPAPINHHWQNRAVAYVDDAATLVPLVTNKIRQSLVEVAAHPPVQVPVVVDLAESETVPVHEVSEPHKHLEFTELPEVQLSGDLAIQDIDTESDFIDSEPVSELDLEPEVARPGVTLRYGRTARSVQSPVRSEQQVLANTQPHHNRVSVPQTPVVSIARVSSPKEAAEKTSHLRRGPVFLLPAVVVAAVVFAIFLMSGSSTLRSDGSTARESFSFRFSTLTGALVFFSQKP